MSDAVVDARHTFKVVVAGSFASGKTTLIQQISDSEVVGTEAPTSGAEAETKPSTTVGMEFGTLTVGDGDDKVTLSLFGVPGQDRFRFMWDITSAGADGFLMLADASRPDTWGETHTMASYLRSRHSVPMVLGVNRADDETTVGRVSSAIATTGLVPVRCDVTDRRSARDALLRLLLLIDDHLSGEGPITAMTPPTPAMTVGGADRR